MSSQYLSFSKIALCALMLAVVDTTSVVPYSSDAFGVLIAMTGGLLVMGRRAEAKDLSLWQACCEVGLSGVSGYLAHAASLRVLEDPRMVWSACLVAGLAGSKGAEAWMESKKKKEGVK